MKESFQIKGIKGDNLHVFKFTVLLQVAMEYFVYAEEALTKNMEIHLSTKYKERFVNPDRKTQRRIAKAHEAEMRVFRTQFKAFKNKNKAMLDHLEAMKLNDPDMYEEIMDAMFKLTDKLIIEDEGTSD